MMHIANESKWGWSLQFSSVTQSCQTLCDPMNHSTPRLPVHHQLLKFTQTHAHWVSDAIQPSHPLSSPSPPAFNLSQHQGLFKWVSSSHQVAKIHLSFLLKQTQSIPLIYKAFEKAQNFSDDLNVLVKKKKPTSAFHNVDKVFWSLESIMNWFS